MPSKNNVIPTNKIKNPLWKVVLQFFTSPELFYRYGAKIVAKMMYDLHYSGFENIPETGPALLISNHISYVDGLIIHTIVKRPVRFIIDEEIYEAFGVKHFMELSNAIPIAPNKKSVKWALEQVSEAMKAGDIVCIFPEGSLTYTGNMTRFRFGIEWMANQNDVPVIPMALKGLWGSIFSRKYIKQSFIMRLIPRTFRMKVVAVCGKPILSSDAKINYLQRKIMELKNSIE